MNTMTDTHIVDPDALSEHLQRQILSVRRMIEILDHQREVILRHEVAAVVAAAIDLQGEIARRMSLEQERASLLTAAASRLGCAPAEVGLKHLLVGLDDERADLLRSWSEELRGLISELSIRNIYNRDLIQQELGFVEFMLEAIGETAPLPGYGAHGHQTTRKPTPASILDVKG